MLALLPLLFLRLSTSPGLLMVVPPTCMTELTTPTLDSLTSSKAPANLDTPSKEVPCPEVAEMIWVAADAATETPPPPTDKTTPKILLAPTPESNVLSSMFLLVVETCPEGVGLVLHR